MATQMTVQRTTTRKRDAETAFAAETQFVASRANEEEAELEVSTHVRQHTQQLLVNDLFKASRKNIRKHVNRLVDETHSIFSAVENNAESLKDGYNSELNNSLERMEQYLAESKAARTQTFSLSLDQLEKQLAHLDHLGDCYADKGQDLAAELDVHTHTKRREQHKTKVSHRGAQVAQMQMKKAADEIQTRVDKKHFLEAHREFIKAIQSSRSQV